jgi:parallel beta-helix repeat protein
MALAGGVGGIPIIQNNLITDTTIGIYVDILVRDWFSPNIPQIHHNIITKNSVGIRFRIVTQNPYGEKDPTAIQDNTISQNVVGIKLVGYVEQCTIQNNNI